MQPGVLVFGCSEESTDIGLKADVKAIEAQEIPAIAISTGSVVRHGESQIEVSETSPSTLREQVEDAISTNNWKVVKIGALFSEATIGTVSTILRQDSEVISVIDVEPFFKTGLSPIPEVVKALIKDILPSIDVLSATVPEVKTLLEEAGVAFKYPNSVRDVQIIGDTLRTLGPEYVIIKREFYDGEDKATTLHYVLCGSSEPILATSRCENPNGVFGASHSIPAVVAAYLAKGYEVPKAVSAGFKFIEDQLKGGQYFD